MLLTYLIVLSGNKGNDQAPYDCIGHIGEKCGVMDLGQWKQYLWTRVNN
mgnify:CR=1 FL=1